MNVQLLSQPNDEGNRLGEFIKDQLGNPEWESHIAAVAFVKKSGVRHIYDEIQNFANQGEIRIIVGVDLEGTSIEGLTLLREALNGNGNVWVFHNENESTFHPKVYAFSNEKSAAIAIGSGNLTEGGLFTNYEASVAVFLKLSERADKAFFYSIIKMLDSWSVNAGECGMQLTDDTLHSLIKNGYILHESAIRKKTITKNPTDASSTERQKVFGRATVPSAPKTKPVENDLPEEINEDEFIIEAVESVESQSGNNKIYLMTLRKTDVGIGQTTPGTSRRSPEIFIPLSARDHDPDFWGWDTLFTEDSTKPGKFDRKLVPMRIGGEIIKVNMMTWPDKSDFRLRSESIRRAGNIGDILKIEKSDGKFGYQYHIEIIPIDGSMHQRYKSLCRKPVKNSHKKWGYHNE